MVIVEARLGPLFRQAVRLVWGIRGLNSHHSQVSWLAPSITAPDETLIVFSTRDRPEISSGGRYPAFSINTMRMAQVIDYLENWAVSLDRSEPFSHFSIESPAAGADDFDGWKADHVIFRMTAMRQPRPSVVITDQH